MRFGCGGSNVSLIVHFVKEFRPPAKSAKMMVFHALLSERFRSSPKESWAVHADSGHVTVR